MLIRYFKILKIKQRAEGFNTHPQPFCIPESVVTRFSGFICVSSAKVKQEILSENIADFTD